MLWFVGMVPTVAEVLVGQQRHNALLIVFGCFTDSSSHNTAFWMTLMEMQILGIPLHYLASTYTVALT